MRIKILAVLCALAVALGMVAIASATASAHQGNIVATTVCNTTTGNYDVTYTLSWSNVPSGVHAVMSSRTGTTTFSNGWDYNTFSDWVSRGNSTGAQGSIQWVESLPGNTVGNGPWVYAYTDWSNGYSQNRKHDTRAEGLKGDCATLATATVSFTTPTCDTAQAVILDTPTNAVWGQIKYGVDGATGNKTYDVTATATGKSRFADGTTTKQFQGTLLPATGNCPPGLAVAIYIYPLIDSSKPASWNNSGMQTLIGHRLASSTHDWYTALPTLPSYVCGTGWGVQQDIAQLSSTFTLDSFPPVVDRRSNIGVLGWPPILAAQHQSLSALVTSIPACAPPVAPTVKNSSQTCNTDGTSSTAAGTVTFAAGEWKWFDSSNNEVSGTKNYMAGDYTFTAKANSGYAFDNAGTTTLTFKVTVGLDKAAGPCLILVTPVQPRTTSTDVCGTANDTLTVDSSMVGVTYTVTWNQAHTKATVTASVSDATKYFFAKGATTSWDYTFTNDACPVEITPVQPKTTSTDVCGTANDTLTVDSSMVGVTYTVTWNQAHTKATVTASVSDATKYFFAKGATTSWDYTFTNDACPVEITPVQPKTTSTDVCGTANDTLTVDSSMVGVTYTVTWSKDHLTATVTADVTDTSKYFFAKGATTSWDYTFTDSACVKLTPLTPGAIDPTCPGDPQAHGGYILLDLKPGLHYSIDGVPTTTAQNPEVPGHYTISVTVDPQYELQGPSSWILEVAPPTGCLPTHALYTPTASMKNLTCSGGGSYTLGDTQGAFRWFVNGSAVPTSAGNYVVKDAETVNVKAELIDPVADGWEFGAKTSWTFQFTHALDCLPTLAFTGSNGGAAGLLLAGGFLLIGGAIIALERRFRPHTK